MSSTDLATNMPCNLCGSSEFTVIYGAGVAQVNQIVRCPRCDLMYANPRAHVDLAEIEANWDDPNFDVEQARAVQIEKERLQIRDLKGTRKWLNDCYPSRGRLLELGSSFGFMLDSFRKDGWDVTGIEPDMHSAKFAGEKLQIPTINKTLESAALPAETFDVVIMLHVIEHVPNPVATLQEVLRILKPGGRLILETPRYDTLMFRMLGRRERSLSCDGHIFFFTSDTLRKACEAAGFEIDHLEYTGRSLTLDRLVYNLGVISKNKVILRSVASLSRRLRLQNVHMTINVRDIQRAYLVRP
jgi:2-polyprenyl-3-methyl-5-hydroxy-6-metoxy-1,4-benzoquinol methylase